MKRSLVPFLLAGLALLGAGCMGTPPVAQNNPPVPATTTPTSTETVLPPSTGTTTEAYMLLGGTRTPLTNIDYEYVGHGDLQEWALTRSIALQVLQTRSCEPLKIKDLTRVALPVQFQYPSLCAVIPKGEDAVVVAIGLGTTYESYPRITATAFVLGKDQADLAETVFLDEVEKINQAEFKAYDLRNVEFPSPEFGEISIQAQKDFITQINAPSKELQTLFTEMKKAALTLEIHS